MEVRTKMIRVNDWRVGKKIWDVAWHVWLVMCQLSWLPAINNKVGCTTCNSAWTFLYYHSYHWYLIIDLFTCPFWRFVYFLIISICSFQHRQQSHSCTNIQHHHLQLMWWQQRSRKWHIRVRITRPIGLHGSPSLSSRPTSQDRPQLFLLEWLWWRAMSERTTV